MLSCGLSLTFVFSSLRIQMKNQDQRQEQGIAEIQGKRARDFVDEEESK